MTQTPGPRRRLLVFANQWGLLELPRRPSSETWSFGQCLERVAAEGFDGCQAGFDDADTIRSFGLRYAGATRINQPADADDQARLARDCGAECLTAHVGWGMETDDEIDRLVDVILDASARHGVAIYPETHRATAFQDIRRTCDAIARRPALQFNGDFSHFYCGQEMTYRGFATTREYLRPILARTCFIHARVSDGEVMQADISDPRNGSHLANFRWMWAEAMRSWLERTPVGGEFYFSPELGPPSSGYSVSYRDTDGRLIEIADRWQQTLLLRDIARSIFDECTAERRGV